MIGGLLFVPGVLLWGTSLTLQAPSAPCPALTNNVIDTKFAVGQVWAYTTRPQDKGSTVTVLHIDRSEKIGMIVHVRVDGLRAHNARGQLVPLVEHMPFTRDAMLASVTYLVQTGAAQSSDEGYNEWRRGCGGVYTISVSSAVDVMEKTLNSQ